MTEKATHAHHVLVTGGAGYVGSALVPRLLDAGHKVTVLDLYMYGEDALEGVRGRPKLREIVGDLRDRTAVERALSGCDAVIHLACISNDPSYDLDPELGRSINYDAFEPLVRSARDQGVRRFIYASSSSVYGVREEAEVTEDLALKPLTDYSKYKAMCEEVLARYQAPEFTTVTIRPATVCGYAPRMRFDLTVNILTNHAVNNGRITVFGGGQRRPNIHIDDMVRLYQQLLHETDEKIAGKVFNCGYQNQRVGDLAEIVRATVSGRFPDRSAVEIVATPTDDTRSYHVSSKKIARDLGFEPRHSIEDAVGDLCHAFSADRFRDPLNNSLYFNIKRMQELRLK